MQQIEKPKSEKSELKYSNWPTLLVVVLGGVILFGTLFWLKDICQIHSSSNQLPILIEATKVSAI